MKRPGAKLITILFFMAFLITGNTLAYTVRCYTKNGHGRRFVYKATYPYKKRRFKIRTARYALKSCRRKSIWPRSCRLTGCRTSTRRYRCYSYYRYNGRIRRFYRIGLTKRNGRFRSLMSCSHNRFRRRYGLHCYFGDCKRIR